ncbi:lipocalin family protein [Ideonella sp.]|uniref:lipocalin family protein n=1 Tax=Ideonella sp. TaxID=1929293 RepID=UPI0035B44249
MPPASTTPNVPSTEAAGPGQPRGMPAGWSGPPGPHEPQGQDLDERILRAELDLMARDERVRDLTAQLDRQWTRLREPSRWAAPAAGVGLAVAALWAWRHWAHRHPSGGARARPGSADARVRRMETTAKRLSVLQVIAMVWPFLPRTWHQRWGPTSTSAMFNLGGSLARRWMAGRGQPPFAWPPGALDMLRMPGGTAAPLRTPATTDGAAFAPSPTAAAPAGSVQPVAHVDLTRYAGTWHEIARLPNPFERPCAGQPQAHYTLVSGGQLRVENRCQMADGGWRRAVGEARVVAGSGGARLKVSFLPPWLRWMPVGWADYWVLFVDEGYNVALVGEPHRRQLWLLSRTPRVPRPLLERMLEQAERQGFPIGRLIASA